MFSNPRITCSGLPCGVPAGNANEADASLAINNVRDEIAAFLPSTVAVNYQIRAKHSSRCVEVYGHSTANGGKVSQWDCHGGNNQRYRILDAGNGYWQLKVMHSGKCVSVKDGAVARGAAINQWDCNTSDSQKLKATNMGSNLYQLTFKNSGQCLDISGAGPVNGAAAIQWDCNGGDNQRFYIERLQ